MQIPRLVTCSAINLGELGRAMRKLAPATDRPGEVGGGHVSHSPELPPVRLASLRLAPVKSLSAKDARVRFGAAQVDVPVIWLILQYGFLIV